MQVRTDVIYVESAGHTYRRTTQSPHEGKLGLQREERRDTVKRTEGAGRRGGSDNAQREVEISTSEFRGDSALIPP